MQYCIYHMALKSQFFHDFCFRPVFAITSAECYNVLSPFLNFLSGIYRWNRNEVFYLLSSSDVAYLDWVGIYKAFNFAASPKIEC